MMSKMAQADLKGMFQAPGFVEKKDKHDEKHGDHCWMNVEDDDDDDDDDVITTTSESSLGEYSRTSQGSTSCSSDLVDDASSSTSNSSTICNGPLYEMSELMAQLPIKRGLSKYFQGKSQSFTSLSSVKSLEDLAKKETPYRKKMKACKSYGGGLDTHKFYPLPRATISKKVSRNSLSLSFPGRRSSFLSGRPPPIPVQKNFSSV
ncbi:PREDICTED: uncharacterized protein LOC18596034 [Theobroma cacao]|uniref:Uncharacterized protein LOC18596034 n=1 Tax=Theobroma cacao TaxID=3641 RepID=A0AB32V0I3_THECC|nr:PREDICTED: uncharacterized protein LOC18596034 [Theobroma cacao]